MGVFPKNRLTVLHVFSGDLWAGAEVMVYNLCKRLKESPELNIMALSLNEGILAGKLRNTGIETYVIPEAENRFPGIVLKALRVLKGKRIEIIHSHRMKENCLALFIAKYKGVKHLVTTVHGLPEPPLPGQREKNPIGIKVKLHFFILKHFFSSIIAVSNEMKGILVRKYGLKDSMINVILNGIPHQLNIQSTEPRTDGFFRIGTVGRMVPVKDYNLFLEVASQIKKYKDNCQFSILGDGPLREELFRKAKKLGIEDDVDFLKPKPEPQSYYKSIDLYLNTSIHEGMPLSILEAMSCGKPVIAPKVGGIPEVISSRFDGILVDGREVMEFVNACVTLIKDRELRESISANASKTISNRFNDLTMASSYLTLYRGFFPLQAETKVLKK